MAWVEDRKREAARMVKMMLEGTGNGYIMVAVEYDLSSEYSKNEPERFGW